ncbi:hypothetical protein IGI39_004191 [Enterococcus sp. AZ135]|uniref:flavodoxin n=1 Tax=unclassified Enterococcus TaxID=2608891 RepID=UPI003F2970F3
MKKMIWLFSILLFLGACGTSNSNPDESNDISSDSQASKASETKKSRGDGDMKKTIIVYYSLTENTKAVAEEIQEQVAGEMLRIETLDPYPTVYEDVLDRVQAQRDADELPEISKQAVDFSNYDTIFLGTPIWFGEPALPVKKWLDENDLTNKNVYPFFTSGSSSINESMAWYRSLLTHSTIKEGLGITSSNKNKTSKLVEEWLDTK